MSNPHRAVSVTTSVHFVGFAGLPAQRGERVKSEKFTCFGNEWKLLICPGGHQCADEGMVSVFLYNMSSKSINVEIGLSVKGCVNMQMQQHIFLPVGTANSAWGYTNYVLRSKIMDSLVDGALVIEVNLKHINPPTPIHPPFIPENPSCKIIQGMFMDGESADIVFEVGGQQSESNARKKAKQTSSVNFPAHRLIMRKCSPTLAELCGSEGFEIKGIMITSVKSLYEKKGLPDCHIFA
jgi:hypothetical protein